MPRRSSSKRGRSSRSQVNNDDDEEEAEPVSQKPTRRRTTQLEVEEEEVDDDDDAKEQDYFGFSQQAPEASQGVLPERPADRRNLDLMDRAARDKAVTSLSRLILFKALDREPIDRLKVAKDAGISDHKISSAAFQEASQRLRNVFGFELSRIPKYMEGKNSKKTKFTDRLFVLNGVADTADGSHSKAIHAVHAGAAMEKGLLMLTLALIFCKGESRSDGSRWILARDLYRLWHHVDESIPEEPPVQGSARSKASGEQKSRMQSTSPNVDYLLEQFVHMDYLMKEKASEENFSSQTIEDGDVLYSMGPRAAMEVGRKQVIYFCAEILDEEPDPTMLQEVELQDEEDDEEGTFEVFNELGGTQA
jgi:hypothetical protein